MGTVTGHYHAVV